MISINDIHDKHFNKYSIFAIVFIFHLICIFQGLDVTDIGFHLTNQLSAFSLPVEFFQFNSFYLLTDLVGGFWLYLIGGPNLLWARLGGVLVISLNAAIIFSILSDHFERKKVFFVVLISTLFLTMRSGYIINYFTFPAILINTEFWILNKILMEKGDNRFHNFMLGFMVIPIALSRIPLILVLIIPIIMFIYSFIKRLDITNYTKYAIESSLGLCSGVIFFGFIYWIIGVLNGYFDFIYSMIIASASDNISYVVQSHTISSLIRSYLVSYRNVAMGTLILCILFYTLSLIKNRLGPTHAWIISLSMTFAVIFFMLYRRAYIDLLALDLLQVFIGIIILVSLIYVFADNYEKRNVALQILIFAGIIVMIVNPAGSNTGIIKSFYGMWLILPLTILCGYQLKISAKSKSIRSIFSLMNCALFSLLILALFFHSTNIYRDDINRFELNTEFSSPGLRGIYSTPDRVEVVDEVLNKIKELTNKNDTVLMGISIPMFYYLTETRSALRNSWHGSSTLDYLKSGVKDMEETGNYPKIFIKQKISTTDRFWPKGNVPLNEKYQITNNYLVDTFVNHLNYTLVWENNAFAIYKQSKSQDCIPP